MQYATPDSFQISCSRLKRMHLVIKAARRQILFHLKVAAGLEIEPKPDRHATKSSRTKGGVHGNGSFAVHNFTGC